MAMINKKCKIMALLPQGEPVSEAELSQFFAAPGYHANDLPQMRDYEKSRAEFRKMQVCVCSCLRACAVCVCVRARACATVRVRAHVCANRVVSVVYTQTTCLKSVTMRRTVQRLGSCRSVSVCMCVYAWLFVWWWWWWWWWGEGGELQHTHVDWPYSVLVPLALCRRPVGYCAGILRTSRPVQMCNPVHTPWAAGCRRWCSWRCCVTST